jgi:hypothetical protein
MMAEIRDLAEPICGWDTTLPGAAVLFILAA